MSGERLDQLRAMLAEEPGDPFLRYAIALELGRRGATRVALAGRAALRREHPKQRACYDPRATLLAEAGRHAEAVHVCEAGAMQCLVTGDRKTRGELMALREALLDEA